MSYLVLRILNLKIAKVVVFNRGSILSVAKTMTIFGAFLRFPYGRSVVITVLGAFPFSKRLIFLFFFASGERVLLFFGVLAQVGCSTVGVFDSVGT